MLARADPEHDARPVSGPDDHVLRPGRAVHEVPLAQRSLLALDDQQSLAGEHEEVLLVGLPVVHPDRLARPEHEERDPDLRELGVAFEAKRLPAPLAIPPARLLRVQDEPAFAHGHEPEIGLFERRLGNHRRIIGEPRAREDGL